MATATKKTVKQGTRKQVQVTESYRHPLHLGGRSMTYFVDCRPGQSNPHIVRVDLPAGSQDWPTVYRFATVEEARECWGRIRSKCSKEGYVRI